MDRLKKRGIEKAFTDIMISPFGASMSFLLASPLLNPVILGLILTLMGWRVALIYAVFTFLVAVFAGVLWKRLGLAGDFKRVRVVQQECCCCAETVPGPVTRREKIMPYLWMRIWVL